MLLHTNNLEKTQPRIQARGTYTYTYTYIIFLLTVATRRPSFVFNLFNYNF